MEAASQLTETDTSGSEVWRKLDSVVIILLVWYWMMEELLLIKVMTNGDIFLQELLLVTSESPLIILGTNGSMDAVW